MHTDDQKQAATGSATDDRRQYHAVRSVFEEAIERIRPFFDPDNSWGQGTMDLLAYRTLQEHYPTLSPLEVHVLVTAAERYFRGQRAHVSPAP